MTALTVVHRGWAEPEQRSPLPLEREAARGISATGRALYRDGVSFVPVSGEVHYSRVPRERWRERLGQMRAGGVTVASTYVFWNHHVPERGAPRWEGNLDVAAFVDEVDAAGLELVLRIGPWAHGEARNGGFPDWVQDADVQHRSDDPAYLALVEEWFGQLAAALDGRATPGGPIIGIQVENELYDRPEHLSTLIGIARRAGMSAPLWTATAWGGAELPAGEVLPLFGGYADGFWVDPGAGWQPNFRAHYFFSHDWDDPGVGEDVRVSQGFAGFAGGSRHAQLHGFPPATCELGSGMATAYHRRPVLAAADIAALAQVKIGNGSAWQGYYMFAGGRNPGPGLQESIDTGYPNDLPEFGYDFHAPIGQSGDLHASAAGLRAQHAFLAAFGDRLGGMTSSLPDAQPQGLADRETLRWALRSDGQEGFLLLSHHQPYEQLADVHGVQLSIAWDGERLTVPSAPIDIPARTIARWPVGLRLAGHRVRWATASALTLLAGSTLVLVADGTIPVEVAIDDAPPQILSPGVHEVDGVRLLVLADAADAWVCAGELFDTDGELRWDGEGVWVRGATRLRRFDPQTHAWVDEHLTAAPASSPETAPVRRVRAAGDVPDHHGFGGPRHRAPKPEVLEHDAAIYAVEVPAWTGDAVLDIDWAGDVARLRVDGAVVDDRFWDGERWSVSLRDVGASAASTLEIEILPLSAASTVWLPAGAAARREGARAEGALVSVDAVHLRIRAPWQRVG